MCSIAVDIPEEVLYDTKMSEQEATGFAKKMVALGLYIQNKISLGYAAKIADMTKEDFIKYLGEKEVSIFQFDSEEDFLKELENA